MFTGLVEEMGVIVAVQRTSQSLRLSVKAKKVLETLQIGDSIAVNGACLTVVALKGQSFTADVMPETVQQTAFKELVAGTLVNLERPLAYGGRLEGHLVSGHVDGVGLISEYKADDIAYRYRIKTEPDVLRYVVAKGSIAIDGISLTVVEVDELTFSVSIIPHTAKITTLGEKRPGDKVNLETDLLARYVEKLLALKPVLTPSKQLTLSALQKNGFA